MKVLILVLSCQLSEYLLTRDAQLATWHSVNVDGVSTMFYQGGVDACSFNSPILTLPCDDGYDSMHWKTKLALDYVWEWDWDFIFRTNSTSYVDKNLLLKRALELPIEKCYSGIPGPISWLSPEYLHVDGGGMFLSRDCVDVLRKSIVSGPNPYVEDGEIGRILHGIPIIPGHRVDYYPTPQDPLPQTYLYKCRFEPRNAQKVIDAMKAIHSKKLAL